jgi:predicted dehydrogenase
MNQGRLRVAVVGGGVGQGHIRAFQVLPDLFEVVAVCDIDAAKARKLADEFKIPQAHSELPELLKMQELDVVDICTPSYLHGEQSKAALSAGKHVICEKPLVGSLKEVDELIVAEQQSGKRLMPIFQYRFGHGLQKLKFLIEKGLTGRAYLTTVETSWLRGEDYYAAPWRGKWKTELGGTLVTHSIHAHDMMCYILGPVKRVFARAATLVNPTETEDCVSASLEMVDGSLATLAVTVGSVTQITRHRFCFRNLVAESNTRPYSNSGEPWTFDPLTPELGKQIAAALETFTPLPEGFEGQFYRFYYALQSGAEFPVTIADSRRSLELITALYYSAQTGEQVELPLNADHPRYASWWPEAALSQ